MEKNTVSMTIFNEITKKNEVYEILAEIPVDRTRKRMSLIVKFENEILLLCKGADSIILPRINFQNYE